MSDRPSPDRPSPDRKVLIDTETTGFSPEEGDRVIEIGAVEMIDDRLTGREFHIYLNPHRDVPEEAVRVHGLTRPFLQDKPDFLDIVDELLAFLGDAPLIAHNAGFDRRFLNAELAKAGRKETLEAGWIDTLQLARQKFPGAPANLDALARRLGVANLRSALDGRHSAIVDTRLLHGIWIELHGGRQGKLALILAQTAAQAERRPVLLRAGMPRLIEPNADEQARHDAFVAQLKNPLWLQAAA